MKNKITKPSAKIAMLQLSAYGGKLQMLLNSIFVKR